MAEGGGKTIAGVVSAVALGWDGSLLEEDEREAPESTFRMGKGTKEDNLDDRRREREEEVVPEEMVDEMEARCETLCCWSGTTSGSIWTEGKGIVGDTSLRGGGLRFSFLKGGF